MNRPARRTVPVAALLAASLSGFLLSCQTSPRETSDLPALPEAWRNAAGFPSPAPNQDLSTWWAAFDDPVLTRVIAGALNSSPDIAAAAARVTEARAQRKGQAATLLPSLNASASRRTAWTHADGVPDTSGSTYGAGLDASWDADLFGGNRANVAAARASEQAAQANLASAQASLAAETALAYVDLRSAEEKMRVLRETLSTREEITKLAQWRAKAGEIDALELRQAEASLEQARAALPSLQQSIAQTRNRLSLLSGLPPGGLDRTLAGGTGKIPFPARRLGTGIPADTVRQRPDVRAAGLQWVAAVARTRSAEADRLPSLRLSGSLSLDAPSASKVFDPRTVAASLVSGLTAPLFNGGRIRASIEASQAAQEQSLQAYHSAVLTALTEVENELIACRRSAERLATLEKAAVAARSADSLARLRYRTGDSDLLTVLETQRTNLAIEDSLVGIRADRAAAWIRLYKALGGGWARP